MEASPSQKCLRIVKDGSISEPEMSQNNQNMEASPSQKSLGIIKKMEASPSQKCLRITKVSQRQKHLQVRNVLRRNLKQVSTKVPMSTKIRERYVFRFIYIIFTMSPQRKFSWISPLAASFLFSPVDFHHISLERIFMDFSPSNFFSIFPRGFIPCLFEREPWTLPLMVLRFHLPRGFSPCLFEKEP